MSEKGRRQVGDHFMFGLDVEGTEKKEKIALLDSVLKLVQIVAVLASGLWILYQFVTYQKAANLLQYKQQELQYKQQELAAKQSEFNLRTAEAAEKANLAQITLAAQQAEFTLKTEEAQKELRDTELKYAVEGKQIENASNKAKLLSTTTYRASKSSLITAREVSPGLYEVILTPHIRNIGETEFEVSLIIVDCYLGKLNSKLAPGLPLRVFRQNEAGNKAEDEQAERVISDPPSRWHGPRPGSAVEWQLVATATSIYSPAYEDVGWRLEGAKAHLDAFGTGPWKTGEEVDFQPRFIINAVSSDFVGFSVHMLFNRGRNEEDIWVFGESEPLTVALNNENQLTIRASKSPSDSTKP
jgi:hypothetical protein